MTSSVRPRGCGCLMLFSIFCLTAFAGGEVALLFRLNPEWFDRLAFWRGPILKPDVVLAVNPAAREALEREDAEEDARQKAQDGMKLLDDRAVQTDYQPGSATTLRTKEDGVFEFPAGSVREAGRIRVVPIAALPREYDDPGLGVMGPCYKVFVGDHPDYTFARPARAVLHYIPALLPKEDDTSGLGICVWNGKGWDALPSTVDAANHSVAADVPHCSPVLVVWLGKLAVTGVAAWGLLHTLAPSVEVWAVSSTIGGVNWVSHLGAGVYKTENFTISYTKEGPGAPPSDAGPDPFPLAPDKRDPQYPNFVLLIGERLEHSRAKLPALGMPVPERWVFNHQVYLKPVPDAFGETEYGGPMKLTVAWRGHDNGNPTADVLRNRIRVTVTHELIHVAQSGFFSGAAMNSNHWWMEMTAAYLADVFWAREGEPTDEVRSYDLNDINSYDLLQQPIDRGRDDHDYYRYAAFLKWLERDGPERVLRVIDRVNRGGDGSAAAFNGALRAEYGKSLGELLEAFAQDYYQFDLRGRAILPPTLLGVNDNFRRVQSQAAAPREKVNHVAPFTAVARVPAAGRDSTAVGELNLWAATSVPQLNHLSTLAFPVLLRAVPRDRKAKLVVKYEPPDAPDRDFSLSWARAAIDTAAVVGQMEPFTPVEIQAPRTSWVIPELGTPGQNNLVTILLSNHSLTRDLPSGRLERWLLLRPAWVSAGRKSPPGTAHAREWVVCWHPAELKDKLEAFKGYNVYRRKKGEPDSALQRVASLVPNEILTDEAPDDEDYAYVVRVVDVLGNESADSPLDETDPFQGLLDGEVQLVEGSLVEPFLKVTAKAGDKINQQEQDEINKIQDPNEKARRQREWDQARTKGKEIYDDIAQLLRTFEQFARLGLPLKVKIRMTDGKYYLSVPEFCYVKTGAGPNDEVRLEGKRDDRYTLRVVGLPEDMPPLELRLWRAPDNGRNEIRGDYEVDIPNGEGNKVHCKFRWELERLPPGEQ